MVKFEGAIIDREASFAYFVYPFLFETKEFEARVKAIENAQLAGREERLITVWEQQQFPEDDLLFHVANYLNPTGKALPTASLWKLNEALRDTFGFRADWQLLWSHNTIPFSFGQKGQGNKAVQLALFRIGVGFLTVHTQPRSSNINDWLNFLHYFRFLRGQRGVRVQAQKRTNQHEFSQFFPELAGGVAHYKNSSGPLFDKVLTALLNTGSQENSKYWWREVFVSGQMLPFVALFADKLPENDIPYLLYKLHNFFHAGQGNNPAPEDLQPDNPALLPYAKQQWFIFSLEGGGFVAADAPPTDFFRQTLPAHLHDRYFLLFLLALHQRFTLMMLSATVAESWLVNDGTQAEALRQQVFENIRNQLLVFTARGYFTQVMQRQHHHRCYRKWQEVFQLERLYQEVNDEVREMQEYSLMQQTRRRDEADKERDRQYLQELRAKDEADKERDRQYLQELRAKDEAIQKRDRHLVSR